MRDNINTIIGKDTTIEGNLEVVGALRVDGRIKGRVVCQGVISIGNHGIVEADIEAKAAIISGEVRGNIHAEERTELQSKSIVAGDIRTKSLVIEQGAMFRGACQMSDHETHKDSDK